VGALASHAGITMSKEKENEAPFSAAPASPPPKKRNDPAKGGRKK